MTLNAIFKYPDLYHTAIAVAPVANQRYYDTIYQERYMGLPKDNVAGFRVDLLDSPAIDSVEEHVVDRDNRPADRYELLEGSTSRCRHENAFRARPQRRLPRSRAPDP